MALGGIVGRFLMYGVIALLGAFVLGAMLLVDSGDQSTPTVGEITVPDLLLNPETYENMEISTRGTLSYDKEKEQFSVGDEILQIRLFYEPGGIEDLIDERVRVTGRLAFDSEGVFLDGDRVRPS